MKNDLVRDKAIEKLVAGRLRAQLKAPGPGCPDAETLAAYVERTLAAEERRTWETHLAACSRCQEQVAALVRLAEAEEPAGVTAAASISRAPRFRWAWAASALVALVIAGLWYKGEFRQLLRQSTETTLKAPAPGPAREAAPEAQATGVTSPPSARREAAKVQPPQKEREEAALPVPPAAAKTSTVARKAESAGLAGKGAAMDRIVATGPGEAGGVGAQAIATPSERARLAAASAGSGVGAGAGTGRKIESQAKDDRFAAPVLAPAPVPPATPKPADEATLEKEVLAREEAKEAPLAAGLRAAPTVAPKAKALSKTANWRVGPRGLIQKYNGSGNWVTQTSGVETDLFDITVPTSSVGWAVGRAGTILRTTDGGTTWSRIASPTTEDLVRVTATSEAAARVVTRGGQALATTDGGKSWRTSPRD